MECVMKLTGGCFCGALAYEADVDPERVLICHCRDCQIFGGSAYRMSGIASSENFKITRGDPAHFDKQAESGAVRRMVFCRDCGTHLCSTSVGEAATASFVSVRVATAAQFYQLAPRAEIYCKSRVPWLTSMPGCQEFSGMPGS